MLSELQTHAHAQKQVVSQDPDPQRHHRGLHLQCNQLTERVGSAWRDLIVGWRVCSFRVNVVNLMTCTPSLSSSHWSSTHPPTHPLIHPSSTWCKRCSRWAQRLNEDGCWDTIPTRKSNALLTQPFTLPTTSSTHPHSTTHPHTPTCPHSPTHTPLAHPPPSRSPTSLSPTYPPTNSSIPPPTPPRTPLPRAPLALTHSHSRTCLPSSHMCRWSLSTFFYTNTRTIFSLTHFHCVTFYTPIRDISRSLDHSFSKPMGMPYIKDRSVRDKIEPFCWFLFWTHTPSRSPILTL